MRGAAIAWINASQLFLGRQINHGNAFARAGDERRGAICRHGDLVRILHRRHAPQHVAAHWIDDGERACVAEQHEQPRW